MPTRNPFSCTVAAGVAGLVLSGCITGERPTLVDEQATAIDDEAALAVFERLDTADERTFTADYSIIPTSTGAITPATVVVDGTRQRITIGDVEYISNDGTERTCLRSSGECDDFINDARVSDLNITNQFWGDAFAARLRLDAARRVGFPESSTVEIAALPATCVDLPLPGPGTEPATVRYCALDQGPLARYVGADVSIEMTSFTPDAGDFEE